MISKSVPPFSGLIGLFGNGNRLYHIWRWNFATSSNLHIYKTKEFIFKIKESSLVCVWLKLVTLFIRAS